MSVPQAENFAEGLFQTADGPKIEFRDYPAVGGARGAPVLMLHGLTRNVRDFEELAPMVAALGRRVLTASQRGRSKSDPDPQPERYTPMTYAGDMLGLLGHCGVDKAVFVGTSMGGLMTMITAAIAPDRMVGAVLNDIGPELDPAGLARIQGYVGVGRPATTWEEAAARIRDINAPAFPLEKDDAFWMTMARRTYRELPDGALTLDYDPKIAGAFSPASQLQDLWPVFDALKPIPTLVVRGAISDILAVSTVEEMKRRKPDMKIASVPDVGHAPFMTEPAAWEALQAFLSELP